MEASELNLKLDLINKINELDDIKIIKEIKRFLDFELDEKVYELSQAQKERIAEARTEYKNSLTLTEEQANNEIDKWLKEK